MLGLLKWWLTAAPFVSAVNTDTISIALFKDVRELQLMVER
jgi:hypothetical protein